MLELPELWDICQRELPIGNRVNPRERRMLQAAKLGGQRHLSSVTADREVEILEFVLLSSDLLWSSVSSLYCHSSF